jgi:hypothetical protein
MRGVGPSRFGLPSAPFGAGDGKSGHCAIANGAATMTRATTKNALNEVFMVNPFIRVVRLHNVPSCDKALLLPRRRKNVDD